MTLHTENSDGSDRDFEPSDMCPMNAEEVSEMFWHMLLILLVLVAIIGPAIFFFFN